MAAIDIFAAVQFVVPTATTQIAVALITAAPEQTQQLTQIAGISATDGSDGTITQESTGTVSTVDTTENPSTVGGTTTAESSGSTS